MRFRIKSIIVVFMFMQVVHVTFMWVWLNRYGEKTNEIVRAVNRIR